MADHSPGSSLKNSCYLLSALKKVSGIIPPSQNYGIHCSDVPDDIIIEHNVEMACGPLFHLLCIRLAIAGLLDFLILFRNPAIFHDG